MLQGVLSKLPDVRDRHLDVTLPSFVDDLFVVGRPAQALAAFHDLVKTGKPIGYKVNPAKSIELVLTPPAPDARIEYTVIVRRGDKELTRVRDSLIFRETRSVCSGPRLRP